MAIVRKLQVGESAQNSITIFNRDRVDEWSIDLNAGDTYRFDLQQRSDGIGPLDNPYLELRFNRNDPALVGNDNGGGGVNARIEYYVDPANVTWTHTYWLRVYSVSADKTGRYTISAREVDFSNVQDYWTGGQESLGNSNTNLCIPETFFPGGRPQFVSLGDFDDNVNSLAGKDTLFGNVGNDTIRGGADPDSIDGGPGRDSIFGDGGNDTIVGGHNVQLGGWTGPCREIDLVNQGNSYSGYRWDPRKVFEDGNDTVYGGDGDDEIKSPSGKFMCEPSVVA
jgi:Ca2+-binding RTX toxin-like protein